NLLPCHPPGTMTFLIAGMYPRATYQMFSQTVTGDKTVTGPVLTFTTGPLPSNIPMPTFSVVVPPGLQTDIADRIILHNPIQASSPVHFPDVATDLTGNIIWYYMPDDGTGINTLTRPLPGGSFLSIQDGAAWNPAARFGQYLRQVDLAGNVIHETN